MVEEKRAFDRIQTEHSIKIVAADGSTFPAIASNISLTGMLILCDEPTLNRITPHGAATTTAQDVHVRVRMVLPDVPDSRSKLGLFGRIISVRTGGNTDEYRIGIQFTDYEAGSYNALELYIDSRL
ncbi:MAG TPA: PilZ domain-containing protein [Gammaproteobacteria bacterium]|nr:PilZ domain-containing protein [Gammaproteobacteria bacterium]